jgi:hypothetical protein
MKHSRKKLTTAEFIERARAKHGSLYDYSLVDYVRANIKVNIICSSHGVFEQTPDSHTTGRGCKDCAARENSEKLSKRSGSQFVRKAKEIHGDTYRYEKAIYSKAKLKVVITCLKHGDFRQTPCDHLGGKGCCACGHLKTTKPARALAGLGFEGKAVAIHGDIYDYSQVEYLNAITKVKISCKEHGLFNLEPNKHLSGRGCPHCHFDRNQETHLYIMTDGKRVKIGISINPSARLRTQNSSQTFTSTFKASWVLPSFDEAYKIEQRIHKKLKHLNSGFKDFDGASEWFDMTPSKAVKEVCKVIERAQQMALSF